MRPLCNCIVLILKMRPEVQSLGASGEGTGSNPGLLRKPNLKQHINLCLQWVLVKGLFGTGMKAASCPVDTQGNRPLNVEHTSLRLIYTFRGKQDGDCGLEWRAS